MSVTNDRSWHLDHWSTLAIESDSTNPTMAIRTAGMNWKRECECELPGAIQMVCVRTSCRNMVML